MGTRNTGGFTDENQRYIYQLMLKYKKRCEMYEQPLDENKYIKGIVKDLLNR